MGCDIHIVAERRKKSCDPWIGVWSSDLTPVAMGAQFRRPLCAQRDYEFFTEIAGVRGTSGTTIYPRNLPEDVSDLAWQQYMTAPTDHHSVSHVSVDEFCDAWFRAHPESTSGVRKEYAPYDLLGISGDDGFEYRLVFWFDN